MAPSVSAVIWRNGAEAYAWNPDAIYDLASLTKPLCTAEVALRFAWQGLDLDGPHPILPPEVTPRLLLQHASGWPAHRPFFRDASDRADLVRRALAEPLEAPPGTTHRYSDIGFLALGAVLEAEGGDRIDRLWRGPLPWSDPASEPTDGDRGGPVNDENARAMGGVAPHAGLFGSARQVAACAMRWLDGTVPLASRAFTERGPGTHALGWDTPSPGVSTAGWAPPGGAVGHLGFTGTSLWMDPARSVVTVLLTNRVALTADPLPIRRLRQAWHGWAWTA